MKIKLFFYSFILSLCFSQEKNKTIDGIAAVVENNIILKSDLLQMVNITATQNKININNSELFFNLQEKVLQSMIEQKVLLEMAILDSIVVEEEEVNQALDQQINNLIFQSGSEKEAENIIGQNIKDFRREFWYEMQDRLITEKYQQSILNNIKTTRKEVESFLLTYKDSLPVTPTKVQIRHLLKKIKPNQKSINQSKTKILEIKNNIETKKISFSDAAKQFSEDPGSKNNKGSLGWVKRGSLVKNFENIAFTLQLNKISEPVETEFGLHIIETLKKKGDKINARHILLIPEITKKDRENVFLFLNTLKTDSIKTLKDFKKMVGKYSDDEKTKKIGGSLGWINPETYPISEISLVIKHIEPNICSSPIYSSMGVHLLWIENIKKGGLLNLSDHYTEVENLALNYKKMNWYNSWIDKAKDKFYIKKYIY